MYIAWRQSATLTVTKTIHSVVNVLATVVGLLYPTLFCLLVLSSQSSAGYKSAEFRLYEE